MNAKRRLKIALSSLVFAGLLPIALRATAQENEATRDAAKHFQRGVALYGETDYRAALVEFQRAYGLAPNVAVLYNVAEAEYQLQDYAGALTTFERYLEQTSSADSRRGEVEQTVEVLHGRVGHLSLATDPRGADVTVDDQPVGRTPFDQAPAVSVGHRKVTVSIAGRPSVTRYLDVAAEDTVTVNIQIPRAAPDVGPSASAGRSPSSSDSGTPTQSAVMLRTIGWTATGVLAAGAVSFGILAFKSSGDLQQARESYPTTSATLDRDANATKAYSIVADCFTAAAIGVGGVTVVSALFSSSRTHQESPSVRAWLAPTSAHVEMSF
jgi:tetratricopeptide (TPR) repeat protein